MKITRLVPWLVKAPGTYWGEYFFVEVRTDEGVTGWGEITTTTKIANRSVARMIRELNAAGRRRSVTDRAALAQDIPLVQLHRFARRHDQRGQRHRYRTVGYSRQDTWPTDLRSAR